MSLIVVMLLLSVLTNTLSQLSLKHGITALHDSNPVGLGRFSVLIRILRNPFIIAWAGLVVPSTLLWLKAISMTDLSFAYPFLSLNLVFISFGSVVFLRERVTAKHWTGVGMILLGIVLIAQS